MTTQQKNRVNLILGIAVMLLGILTVLQGIDARTEDKQQRQCLADNFGKLTTALTVRGDLADRESKNRTRSDQSQTGLIVDVFTVAKTREQALAAFAKFQKTQKAVKTESQDIATTRKATPYPPFPPGTCDDALPKPQNDN